MSLTFEREIRRKVNEKVKKLNEKKKNERMQPRRVRTALSLKKENVIVDTFCLFFFVFFSLKILSNLRTS